MTGSITWGATMEQLRNRLGLDSDEALAERLGVSGQTAWQWRKEKSLPRGSNAYRVAKLARAHLIDHPPLEADPDLPRPATAASTTTAVAVRAPRAVAAPAAKVPRAPRNPLAVRPVSAPVEAPHMDVAALVAEIVSAVREATLCDVLAKVRASVGHAGSGAK